MKKIVFVLLLSLMFASVGFAAQDVTSAGTIEIGTTDPADNLLIGLSPQVNVRYYTDGVAAASAQWYTITSVHTGGDLAYATASDVNNIYSQDFQTGSAVATVLADAPTEQNPVDTLVASVDADGNPVLDADGNPVMVTQAAASWENLGWER